MFTKNKVKNLIYILLFVVSFTAYRVDALTGVITGSQVGLRSGATTNSTRLKSLNLNEQVTVNNTNGTSGSGCTNSWYNITSGGVTGYVCGDWLSFEGMVSIQSYGRPWTSPKKAIYGGAFFTGEDYISTGQNTSYLKKFNVSPCSSSIYSHQYQSNLAAPMNEAYSSYVSYKNNGLLKNSLTFLIPVYENMPEYTSHPRTGRETVSNPITKLDLKFEEVLNKEGFDETYKVWLRKLHDQYPNWTFKALYTGLDFNTAVQREKWASSVSGTCSECKDSSNHETESGWFIANDQTVGYFLDPRNYLMSDSILAFEDLAYDEKYTEAAVQSVLSGTFMAGTDNIDNKTYASIFVEAGKAANVSPVYLASLAKQESGTALSNTTNGAKFTYKGVTYEGFYNFFNIGAYSSEENPALAGLTYAAAGSQRNSQGIYTGNIGGTPSIGATSTSKACTTHKTNNSGYVNPNSNTNNNSNNNSSNNNSNSNNNSSNNNNNNNQQEKPKVTKDTQIKSLGVNEKSNAYITNLRIGMTVNELLSKASVTIKDKSGNVITGGSKLTTGSTITFTDGSVRTIVIYGDLNGDGDINSADLLAIRQHMLKIKALSGAYLESAHIQTTSGSVNSSDLLRIRQALLKQYTINQS